MKAIVFDRFGGTEVLHESDIEIPEPGAGQVRVRVKAAGVNALDRKVRSGAMQAAFPTPLPAVPGYELAGVVDAAGEGVTDVQVGDEVVGWADTGSYAEYALATTVAAKPSGLDWEDAVALPIADPVQHEIDERDDVLAPLAQRRQLDPDDVQSIVEVGPELTVAQERFERLIGGGNHPCAKRHFDRRAERAHASILQRVQELCLRIERQLTHLVEEQRAVRGGDERPRPVLPRVRERPSPDAEQLAFDERRGQRGAVHVLERTATPAARVVNEPGHRALAGTSFASQQHGRVDRRAL